MKRKLLKLDKFLFNGLFLLFFNRTREFFIEFLLIKSRQYKISMFYFKNKNNPLSLLAEKYGSDKGSSRKTNNTVHWAPHTYTDIYQLLFSIGRTHVTCVIECGIGTNDPKLVSSMGVNGKPGASLRMWREYFPNAYVIGLDIDERILFEDARIKTFKVDQTCNDSIVNFIEVSNVKPGSVDIFIDDGLHEFNAGITLFNACINLIKDDGFYIIEDVLPSELIKYQNYFKGNVNVSANVVTLRRPGLGNSDNSLILLQKLRG